MHTNRQHGLKVGHSEKKRYNHNHYTSKHATSTMNKKFNSQQRVPVKMFFNIADSIVFQN